MGFATALETAIKPLTDLIVDQRLDVRTQNQDFVIPIPIEEAIIQTALATTTVATLTGGISTAVTGIAGEMPVVVAGLADVVGTIDAVALEAGEVFDAALLNVDAAFEALSDVIVAAVGANSDVTAAALAAQTDTLTASVLEQTTAIDTAVATNAETIDAAIVAQTAALDGFILAQTTAIDAALTATTTAVGALAADVDAAATTAAAATAAAIEGSAATIVAGIVTQTGALVATDIIPATANLYSVWNKLDTMSDQLTDVLKATYVNSVGTDRAFRVAGPESGWLLPPVDVDVTAGGTNHVHVDNFPATQNVNVPSGVAVNNLPAVQSVSVQGTVTVGNFPADQPVSGTVSVANFPASQLVSGQVEVTNFPATQAITVPNRHFLPVVTYKTEQGPDVNYWTNTQVGWQTPPSDKFKIIEDDGPSATSSVEVTNWPQYNDHPLPVAIKATNGTTGHWPNSIQYPLAVSLVQPHSGADFPNALPMQLYRGPSSSTDWSTGEARVITGAAFVNETRILTDNNST